MSNWEPTITPAQAAVRLWTWGYFRDGMPGEENRAVEITDWEDDDLQWAMAYYQGTYREQLSSMAASQGTDWVHEGEPDPITDLLLNTPRCSCPDTIAAQRVRYGVDPQASRWPDPCKDEITFAKLFRDIKGLNAEQTDQAFNLAIASWNEKLDLLIRRQDDLRKGARIWADKGPLGGGTLGWSYLAQNSCAASLEQRINSLVEWSKQYLRSVECHELGHALGLNHLKTERALMYPYARISVYEPQAPDIDAAVLLGYKGREEEPDPPDPPEDPGPTPTDPIVRTELVHRSGRREYFIPDPNTGGGTDWS